MISTEVKRILSRLTSAKYADLRAICEREPLTLERLDEYVKEIASRRLELALTLYRTAQKLYGARERDSVTIISRCYYCCYHVARALVFLVTKDDVDDHSKLPKRLGGILSREDEIYPRRLDKMRELRNEVEYSPFPDIEGDPEEIASETLKGTEEFLGGVAGYFRERNVEYESLIKTVEGRLGRG